MVYHLTVKKSDGTLVTNWWYNQEEWQIVGPLMTQLAVQTPDCLDIEVAEEELVDWEAVKHEMVDTL
jgi:hypothetical protein